MNKIGLILTLVTIGAVGCGGNDNQEQERLQSTVTRLEQEKLSKEEENRRLLAERDALDARARTLQEESDVRAVEMDGAKKSWSEREQNLADNVSDLSADWDAKNTKISELEGSLLHKTTNAEGSERSLNETIAGLNVDNGKLRAEIAEKKTRIEGLEKNVSESQEKLASKSTEAAGEKLAKESSQEALRNKQAEYDNLLAEHNALNLRVTELLGESSDKSSQINEAKRLLVQTNRWASGNFTTLLNEHGVEKSLWAENDLGLRGLLSDTTNRNSELDADIRNLKRENKETRERIETLEGDLASKSTEAADEKLAKEGVQEALRSKQAEYANLLAERNNLGLRVTELLGESNEKTTQFQHAETLWKNTKQLLTSNYTQLEAEFHNGQVLWGANDLGLRRMLEDRTNEKGRLEGDIRDLREANRLMKTRVENLESERDELLQEKQRLEGEIASEQDRNRQLVALQKTKDELLRNVNRAVIKTNKENKALQEKLGFEGVLADAAVTTINQIEREIEERTVALADLRTKNDSLEKQLSNEAFNAGYFDNLIKSLAATKDKLVADLERELTVLKKERDGLSGEKIAWGALENTLKTRIELAEDALREEQVRKLEAPPANLELESKVGALQDENKRLSDTLENVRDPANAFKRKSQEFIAMMTGTQFGNDRKVSEFKSKLKSLAVPARLMDINENKYDLPIALAVVFDYAPRLSQPTEFFVSGAQGRIENEAKFLLATDNEATMKAISDDFYSIEIPAGIPVLYLGNEVFLLPKTLIHPNYEKETAKQMISCVYGFDFGESDGFEEFINASGPVEKRRFEEKSSVVKKWNKALN